MTDAGVGRRVLGGAGWLGAARLGSQAAQFASGLVLARLLQPAEFGLVASVAVITGFAFILFEGGLRSALVHHEHPDQRDYSTVFWVNLLGGVALAVLVWALAPAIADFYREPSLRYIAPVIGLTFACSTSVVHSALLQRQLQFRTAALIEGGSTITGLAVTLVLALADFGAYALAIGPVCSQVVASVAYPLAVRWRPTSFISLASWGNLLRFAAPLTGANTLEYWGRNFDNLVIGRFLGPAPLGYYNRAYNLMSLPVVQLTNSIGSAVSPALARMASDVPRARSAYVRSLKALCTLTVPVMVGLAATAPGLVPLLWGVGWLPTVPLLQVLSLAGIPQCLSSTTSWLYQAQRRTAVMFRMTLLWTALALPLVYLGLRWGLLGIACAVLVRYWLALPFDLYVATRGLDLRMRSLSRDVGALLLPSALMGGAVWTAPWLLGLDRGAPLTVLGQVVLGIALQLVLTALIDRTTFTAVRELLRR